VYQNSRVRVSTTAGGRPQCYKAWGLGKARSQRGPRRGLSLQGRLRRFRNDEPFTQAFLPRLSGKNKRMGKKKETRETPVSKTTRKKVRGLNLGLSGGSRKNVSMRSQTVTQRVDTACHAEPHFGQSVTSQGRKTSKVGREKTSPRSQGLPSRSH